MPKLPSIWYIAVEKFGPSSGEEWNEYLNWAKLPQLKELVSLDINLGRSISIIETLTQDDWKYNIKGNSLIFFFDNVEYLRSRVAERAPVNILAVMREPALQDIQSFTDERFVFQGYDLIERPGLSISAISGCRGFDLAFQPTDVSDVGLFENYKFARIVQQRLRDNYPDEHHAWCYVWAIWKMKDSE